jgi:glycosyltransferase involved in cell wall biosynthesis
VETNLRILILTWEIYPAYVGGLGILVKDLVSELVRQGVEITVLIPNIPDDVEIEHTVNLNRLTKKHLKKGEPIPGLDFDMDYYDLNQKRYNKAVEWESIFHPHKKNKPANRIYPNETPKNTKAFAWAVAEWLKKNKKETYYDCILGMDWLSIPSMQLLKHLKNPTPFYLYINATQYEQTLDKKEKSPADLGQEEVQRKYFPHTEKMISVSGITKNILVKEYGVDPDKITVVYNDVEYTPTKLAYDLPKTGKNVLFLGRIARQKGLAFLIDTAQKVVEIDPAVQFFIAGDGERLPKTVELVAHKNLEKNVLFLGWAGPKEKKILYNTADLFVMPSPSEPFGLTPLEAIKSGTPAISSINCGFADLIKSTPTFRYHDTQGFANLILFFLHNPADRQKLLLQQQADLANHSWTKEVRKVIDLVRRAKQD